MILLTLLSIDSILKFLGTLPIWAKISMGFLIIICFIFKDAISTLIKKIPIEKLNIFKKKEPIYKPRVEDYNELIVHDFFLTLDSTLGKVKQIDFGDIKPVNHIKRQMMLKLMNLKMISMEKHFKELILDESIKNLTAQEFKFKMMSTITELVKEYNELCVVEFIKMGIDNEDSWYFVDSYEGYRSTIVDSFIERLESICISKQYETNYGRLLAILEILTVAVDVIPRDVRSLYVLINGKYDKYINK